MKLCCVLLFMKETGISSTDKAVRLGIELHVVVGWLNIPALCLGGTGFISEP
jgi:hypothetical protein